MKLEGCLEQVYALRRHNTTGVTVIRVYQTRKLADRYAALANKKPKLVDLDGSPNFYYDVVPLVLELEEPR